MFNRPAFKHKYGAKKLSLDGHSFASQLEAALYCQLKLEMKAGIWKSIQCQDHVYMTEARILYIPDFRTEMAEDGRSVWHEAKGMETDVWRLKRRLWKFYGPGELRIYKGSAKRITLTETLMPPNSVLEQVENDHCPQ